MTLPFPKEHGVWAMLATSLVIGFAVVGAFDGAGLSMAASLAFLLMLKAPLKSFLRRRRRNDLLWAALYLSASGLFLLPFLPRITGSLATLTALVMIPSVPIYLTGLARKKEMQIAYEIPAMALLSLAAAFAYTGSGGTSTRIMVSIWLLGFLYYASSSFRVRFHPGSPSRATGLFYDTVLIGTVLIALILGWIPVAAGAAFLPLLEDVWRGFHPKKERFSDLGKIELVKTVFFAGLLIAGYR